MDDLIRRKDAVDLWDKYHSCIATEAMAYDRELRALPSAQPDYTELKPCPFCGRSHGLLITSIHHRLDDITLEQWSVFCDASGDKVGCGASCGYHRTKAEAIEAWNRRAKDERNN